MISFDRLSYSKIPIWENRRRIEHLTLVCDLIHDYHHVFRSPIFRVKVSPTTGQPLDQFQRRAEINERMPLARRIIELSGITIRRVLKSTADGSPPSEEIDLLEMVFDLQKFGFNYNRATDVIDESIGVYKNDQKKALSRSYNPIFWLLRIVEWIAEFPFWLISLLGFNQKKAEESKSGRAVKGVVQISVLAAAFGWLVQVLVNLIQLLHDFGWTEILHRLGFK
jgi:hypothetical protein